MTSFNSSLTPSSLPRTLSASPFQPLLSDLKGCSLVGQAVLRFVLRQHETKIWIRGESVAAQLRKDNLEEGSGIYQSLDGELRLDVAEILSRGPNSDTEKHLVLSWALLGLVNTDTSRATWEAFYSTCEWLEASFGYDAFNWVVLELESLGQESLYREWASVSAKACSEPYSPGDLQSAARISARLARHALLPETWRTEQTLMLGPETQELLRDLALLPRKSENEMRIEGNFSKPIPTFWRFLSWVTGLALIALLFRIVLRIASFTRKAEITLSESAVQVRLQTSVMGKVIRTQQLEQRFRSRGTSLANSSNGQPSMMVEMTYPGWWLALGFVSLFVGVALGGFILLRGMFSYDYLAVALGSGVIALGALFDRMLLSQFSRMRGRAGFLLRLPGHSVRIDSIDKKTAERFARAWAARQAA